MFYFPLEISSTTQDVYKFATHEKGILGSQGAYNSKHRRMCSPPFRLPSLLKQFSPIITDRATLVATTLHDAAVQRKEQGSPLQVDISVHTQRLTLDIVGMTAFSHDFGQVGFARPFRGFVFKYMSNVFGILSSCTNCF